MAFEHARGYASTRLRKRFARRRGSNLCSTKNTDAIGYLQGVLNGLDLV